MPFQPRARIAFKPHGSIGDPAYRPGSPWYHRALAVPSLRLRCFDIVTWFAGHTDWSVELWQPETPYDLVVFSKSSWAHEVEAARQSGARTVLDLCDDYLEANPKPHVRATLEACDWVVTSSTALGHVVERVTPRWRMIPDPVSLDTYPQEKVHESRAPITLLWCGLCCNLDNLRLVQPALHALHRQQVIRLLLLANFRQSVRTRLQQLSYLWTSPPTLTRNWALETVGQEYLSADIALAPLEPTPWNTCKSYGKIATFMVERLPVVASPIPAYRDLIRHGETGFLCEDPQQWQEALKTLVMDRALRERIGHAARKAVLADCTLDRVGACWAAVFEEVLGSR